MSEITFTIDGQEICTNKGKTILEAAQENGVYIPRLCHKDGLKPYGACRVCTVLVNGRPESACTQPAAAGITVENDTEKLRGWRTDIIEMLFVEGNHICPSCEKSGDCELQALGYKYGIAAPRFPYLWPHREVDASHPDVLIDHNRCILCARCVRTSRGVDGKEAFGFVGRGLTKRLVANPGSRFVDTDLDVTDQAVDACPVGAILRKQSGYRTPVGQRKYDATPIGTPAELTVAEGGKA